MMLKDFQEKNKKTLRAMEKEKLEKSFIDFSKLKLNRKANKKSFLISHGHANIIQAIKSNPKLLENFSKAEDKFFVYNSAYFNNGVFVDVKENKELRFVIKAEGQEVIRNMFVIEENASCKIYVRLEGKGDINLANLFVIKKGGKCKFGFLQNTDGNAVVFNKAISKENGEIKFFICNIGKGLKRVLNEISLDGRKAGGNIFDIFLIEDCMAEINSRVYCNEKFNKGFVLSKGIAKRNGKIKSEGYAKISKSSENADLFVNEQAILVENGKAFLLPNLEIENNNVRAGHSASIEHFNDEKIFYLQSRGLNEQESKKLLIQGFLSSLTDKFEFSELKQEVATIIENA